MRPGLTQGHDALPPGRPPLGAIGQTGEIEQSLEKITPRAHPDLRAYPTWRTPAGFRPVPVPIGRKAEPAALSPHRAFGDFVYESEPNPARVR